MGRLLWSTSKGNVFGKDMAGRLGVFLFSFKDSKMLMQRTKVFLKTQLKRKILHDIRNYYCHY